MYTKVSIVETTSLRPVTEPLSFDESTKDSEDDEEIKFDLTSISIKLEREPIRKVWHIEIYSFILHISQFAFVFLVGSWLYRRNRSISAIPKRSDQEGGEGGLEIW